MQGHFIVKKKGDAWNCQTCEVLQVQNSEDYNVFVMCDLLPAWVGCSHSKAYSRLGGSRRGVGLFALTQQKCKFYNNQSCLLSGVQKLACKFFLTCSCSCCCCSSSPCCFRSKIMCCEASSYHKWMVRESRSQISEGRLWERVASLLAYCTLCTWSCMLLFFCTNWSTFFWNSPIFASLSLSSKSFC